LIEERVGSELAAALEGRGFEALTPVQEAVLQEELEGRDLRISSQTGSGKTVAIGLALRASLGEPGEEDASDAASDGHTKGVDQRAHPRAVVVVPTRELAKQVHEELAWLYAGMRDVRIASVTGGGGYRDELRAFRAKPAIIVGTPGRLLDHLKRGAIDAADAKTFVLDEADRMLDLGFREDIEAIFGFAPEGRRTLLVSATFPREVKALADRIQTDPVSVQGTPLGGANEDIEHLLHLVHQEERLAAIINLLLEADGQTLIFARTRADVAELTGLLQDAGFSISSLSGEMEQAERNRALAAFKRGNIDALVATDVAARGIDVSDVTRVIHAEPPTDADAYTHRSGRTGRAGKKGVSSVLVTPREIQRTTALLGRARVKFRFAPLPTAESLRDARDAGLFERLTADFVEGDAIDERSLALAERVLNAPEATRAVGRLISYALRQQTEARDITVITPPEERKREPRAPNRDGWVRFRVSWGTAYGADHRRLMAMLCRRGKIEGRDIGAINLGRTSSVVEVGARVAEAFERATAKPDPRDPKIHIRRWSDEPTRSEEAPPAAPKSKRALPEAPPSAPKSKRALPEAPPSAPKSKRALPEAPPSAPKSKRALPEAPPSAPKSKRALPDAPPPAPKSKRA
jgi:ATP-dependent RNA helicase DeaD